MSVNKSLGGHPMFYQKRRENEQLYSDKHYQYATDADPMSNFRLCGQLIHKLLKPNVNPTIAAALTLMSKQIVGVYEIVGEGKENTVESLADKLRDIEIYATIIQVLVDETKPPTPPVFECVCGSPDTFHGKLCKLYNERRTGEIITFPTANTPVKDGPYCTGCPEKNPADYYVDPDDGDRVYWCSNCAAEAGVDTSDMYIMENCA